MSYFNWENTSTIEDDLSKEERINLERELVSHLMDVGWNVDHSYLERKIENTNYDKDEQNYLARLMWGRCGQSYYLISACNSYKAVIGYDKAAFWFNKIKIAEWPIKEVQLFDKGVKFGPCKIVVEKEINEDWSNLNIRKTYYGWTSKKEIKMDG